MELWAYIKIGDWAQFTGIRQDVLLKIADIVEASGTQFAAPTRLMYLSGGVPTDEGRGDRTVRRREELRDSDDSDYSTKHDPECNSGFAGL
jgi:MscS family membrane protein